MRKGLYARLAADNIKRNAQTYVPYLITCILTTAMTYIIRSLAGNEDLEAMRGGWALTEILALGSHITRIFAFIFLFYTNSFLMKRRKKEFGLFNILGMEKRHIAKVLLLESFYTALISLSAGFAVGILLDKLLFLVLTHMLKGEIPLGFHISVDSLAVISVFMLLTFLMIYLNALRQIHLAKPIELLHGGNVGETEPKAKWLMALLGAALLGAGYTISIVTKEPLKALALFFVAVLCVILGTYLLFTAGSIALLKILKQNKGYYYQIRHFTTVSGMMYRMKQNAVGLANICILSTMVLVMLSSTGCLLAGMEEIINTRFPYDFNIYSNDERMPEETEKFLAEYGADVGDTKTYSSLVFSAIREDDRFYIRDNYTDSSGLTELGIIDLADYNRLTGQNRTLSDRDVLLWSSDKTVQLAHFTVCERAYTAVDYLQDFPVNNTTAMVTGIPSVCLVVSSRAEIQALYELQKDTYKEYASPVKYYYNFNLNSGDEEALFTQMFRNAFYSDNDIYVAIDTKYAAEEDFMSLYGGLFFLGGFLGTLFMMQTILIIYYKQISEGYEDQQRFGIMQNVGMSRTEVKKTIHSQIITVFFLPLLTAGIHTGFAFPLICRLLVMFNMTNTKLFALSLLLCFGIFALIYALIYTFTAKTYYKIVRK